MLMLVSGLEVTGFASNLVANSDILFENISTESNKMNIENEIISKRTACSKVYLLEDGSYYQVSTCTPIHEKVNGEWENISDELEKNTPQNTHEVDSILRGIEGAVPQLNVSKTSDTTSSSFDTYYHLCNKSMAGLRKFTEDSRILIKPTEIDNYLSENKTILEAKIAISCSNVVGSNRIYVKEINKNWTLITQYEDDEDYAVDFVDCLDINANKQYYIDITEIFYRWESGDTPVNGILLYSPEDCSFSVNIDSISIRYDILDEEDIDYTYHTIKMGRAGTLYVNDFTNTIRLEQEIFNLDKEILPVFLKRFFSSSNVSVVNGAGIGSTWNYSSFIEREEEMFKWTLLDGSVKYFKAPENSDLVINGNYKKWIEFGPYIGDAALWFDYTDETDSYENVYIELDGATYRFNEDGQLLSINIDNHIISITYNISEEISSISVGNSTLIFSYEANSTGATHIKKIDLKKGNNAQTTVVQFTTEYDESLGKAFQQTDYNDGTSVIYEYDDYGNLLSIILDKETQWDLFYANGRPGVAENCQRLSSCKEFKLVNGEKNPNDLGECLLEICTDGPYQRTFKSSHSSEETLFFDKNINVVSHRMSDGSHLFASYDDNNLLNSYVVSNPKENENNLLLNSDFEIFENQTISNWNTSNNNVSLVTDLNTNNKFLQISSSNYIDEAVIEQACSGPFDADQTYVFGAWVKLNENTLTSSRNGFKINIYLADQQGKCDKTNGLVESICFDTCIKNEWVYKLAAFKLEDAQDSLYFSIEFDGPSAIISVDDTTLYKANISKEDIPGVTTSALGEVHENADGSISEILSDQIVSMVKTYEYDDSGRVTSITDHNGITTYYKYNNKNELIEIGNSKVNDEIINPTMFTYTEDLSKTIQQTITNVDSGNTTNIIAGYSYVGSRIESVTHNDLSYHFEYFEDRLERIYTETFSDSNSSTQVVLIDYIYNTYNNIEQIQYANGLTVEYIYDDDNHNMISEIKYSLQEGSQSSVVKTLTYSYDNNGLSSVIDSQAKTRTVYTNDGYVIYLTDNDTEPNNDIILYMLTNNADGSQTETYFPNIYYSDGGPFSLSTTSKTLLDYNPITQNTTKTSNFSTQKLDSLASSESDTLMFYDYHRQSVCDYFGRIIQKDTELQTPNINEKKTKLTEAYSYQDLGNGVTSNLISSYSTIISEEENPTPLYSECLMYEYDNSGNIVLVYVFENGIKTPLAYYAYDEAGQIKGEINYCLERSVTYTYDEGGNLKTKQNHLFSEAIIDDTTNTIVSYGTATDCDSFQFDCNKLVSYNNHNITYDTFGNPLKYYGTLYDVYSSVLDQPYIHNTIEGNLEWSGNKLSSFENNDMRCEYFYDENGYRIKQIYYKGHLNMAGNEYEYIKDSETYYIWNNGVLKSVIMDDENHDPLRSDIIYDQEGQMAGFVSYTGHSVFFVKDINGSVRHLVSNDGITLASVDYDAWGMPLITYCAEDQSNYLLYMIITLINPSAFNGYLFDYNTGLYFCREKVYSPSWGRYLNMNELTNLLEPTNSAISANLYSFCNNNPINIIEPYSAIANNKYGYSWNVNGLEINMSDAFLSRPFCMVFANQILKVYGTWDYNSGHNYKGMDSTEIAATLFAKTVGKNAMFAINKVNACWGDGWIIGNKNVDTIILNPADENCWKYIKIWYAAPDIKMYAWSQGIYITI